MDYSNVKLCVTGAGKMASSILVGAQKNGFLNCKNIFIYDVNVEAAKVLASKLNCNYVETLSEALKETNTVLIATKPFVVNEVLTEIKKDYNNHLILSILAGVKIEKYLSVLTNAKVVRIMPNTPALVQSAMSAVCASVNTDNDSFNFAFNLMKNCGEVIKTTEDKIDVITALSGSGPAYYYKIIDLMAQSAVKLGLDYKEAILLSAQTALGSAKMVLENDFNINQLITNVTTPGGCTEVGNNVLNDSNINEIVDKTITDTMIKAKELGKN